MRPLGLAILAVLTLTSSCSKSKNEVQNLNGSYGGVSLLLLPLARPADSTVTTVTLNLESGRFSGTSDTTLSALAVAIGQGGYVTQSGKIIFSQDSLTYADLGPTRSLLSGSYDLIRAGDSLVFQRLANPALIGGGSVYFRLRVK